MPADPIQLRKKLWPHYKFYDKQVEIAYSVEDNDETVVVAGNMLGKDFITAWIVLYFFLTRTPCRIVTTSVKDDHLRILWSEINRHIAESKFPLTKDKDGPLIVNHREIRKVNVETGEEDKLSYIVGMVSSGVEGLSGHHIAAQADGVPRTLAVGDETSGLDDKVKDAFDTWANRQLYIGNPWPCENFFKYSVKGFPGGQPGGNVPRDPPLTGYHRNVIKIRGEDSPNVRFAQAEIERGLEPSHTLIVPGVKSYAEYLRNRKMWDEVKQCVGLDAEFYEGAEAYMFPEEWLELAAQRAEALHPTRQGEGLGCDPAEGGDNSSWAVTDEAGLISLESKKTPDTTEINRITIFTMRQFNVPEGNVCYDRGGGGSIHVDALRREGYHGIRSVAFGASVTPEDKFVPGKRSPKEKLGMEETAYTYFNLRAMMYGKLRELLNPSTGTFAIPRKILYKKRPDGGPSLRDQLKVIPLRYDNEGRLKMLPKRNLSKNSKQPSLTTLIGCSPDEADALVLAVHAMAKVQRNVLGKGAFG